MIKAMSSKVYLWVLYFFWYKKIVIYMALLSDGAQAVLNQQKVPDKKVNN